MRFKLKIKKFTILFMSLMVLLQSGCSILEQNKHPTPSIKPTNCKIIDTYDYAFPVKANIAVDDSYFEDAVFIGDSRTVDVAKFSTIPKTTVYAAISLAINQLDKKEVIEVEDGIKVTVMEALKRKQFNKIYIMYGYNELGWIYPEIFIEKYKGVIDQIQTLQPDALIYVELIYMPTKKVVDKDNNVSEEKIIVYNNLIKEMAIEKKLYLIDLAPVLEDPTGYLFEEGTVDGVHLEPKLMSKWYEFIKTRTVVREEYEKEDCFLP